MNTLRQQLVVVTCVIYALATAVILLATRHVVSDAIERETARAADLSTALLSSSVVPLFAEHDVGAIDEATCRAELPFGMTPYRPVRQLIRLQDPLAP
ncbi:hypothetical protein GCM10025771_05850 [Niveibacterium umoris]|uniref:Uncharacterized protein n=1 Tax=Niveibacterium umoris TaxID=1193620 RepID=A0A840BU30_9RHOO|nr:hypothetical protein [Niveibacterium umoris]MBB4013867.1 hypothetical protein [Niveibacterium umoris]